MRIEQESGGENRQVRSLKFKVGQSWPNLAPRDGQRFEMRTLFSAGAKRAESSVKRRHIRRPFHSDVHLLRSYNPGEKSGVECISGQRLSSIVYHAALSLLVMRDMIPIQEVGVELGDSVLINPPLSAA